MIFPKPTPRVADLVSRHNFVLDTLPAEPSGGLPLGNGDVGASFYGDPGFIALSISKNNVYVGTINLHVHTYHSPLTTHHSPTHLRLYDATAQVSLSDGIEVETFAAAQRSLVVLRIRSQGPAYLPITIDLCHESRVSSPKSDMGHGTRDTRHETQVSHDGPFHYLRCDLAPDLTLVMCGFVYGARSNATVREGAVLATFEVPPSGECLILVGVATSRDDPNPTRRARTEVERALPHGYLLLQREHAVWWERFWAKSEAEISHPLTEGFYYRNLYLSKVTSREGSRRL